MAAVRIESGEFPLLRNVDATKQPNRARVYGDWISLIHYDLPKIVEHLPEVIEDVYAYEVWKDKYLDSPEQFFERIGLFGLDLKEPARLIDELRKKGPSKKKREIIMRAQEAKKLRERGQTQQEIAVELGVHRNTVAADLCTKNSVRTEKIVHKQPRTRTRYEINEATDPTVAAQRIRAKFGEEYAQKLKKEL